MAGRKADDTTPEAEAVVEVEKADSDYIAEAFAAAVAAAQQ
jgi:hypothetical protein